MNKPKTDRKKLLFNYGRYSGMAFQMLFIILAGVFGGYKLDDYLGNRIPVFTIIFSLLSVALAIYQSVKDLLKNGPKGAEKPKSKSDE